MAQLKLVETQKIISKIEAISLGLKTYFTGQPCKNGHIDFRSVANGVCYQCRRDSQNSYRAINVEEDRASSRAWYAANKERARQRRRDWIAANPDKYAARRFKYRQSINGRAKEMLAAAKFTAKKQGIVFDLDKEWIAVKLAAGKCELTDIPFNLTPIQGRQNPYTASLDRIIPAKGYIKSNVRMILWALNAAFNTYGEDVYADIARVYLARRDGTGLS